MLGWRQTWWARARPGRGQGIDSSRPVPEAVMKAVRRSGPPKQILVVRGPRSHVLQHLAGGGDDGDAAVQEGGDAHVAVAVDGQRVEPLHAGQAGQAHAGFERGTAGASWPGPVTGGLEEPARVGLGPVQHGPVR